MVDTAEFMLEMPKSLIWLHFIVYLNIQSTVKIINSQGSFIIYEDLADLESQSEYILIGEPTQNLESRTSELDKADNGSVVSFCTYTNFKIDKIIKQPDQEVLINDNQIKIIEPFVLDQSGMRKSLLKVKEYKPLAEGVTYVVFLADNGSIKNFELGGGIALKDNILLLPSKDDNSDINIKKAKILEKYSQYLAETGQ